MSFRWLYALMLSVDANFKQKARLHSDVAKDPPLGPGWGTFVENRSYLEHVSQSANQDFADFSLCWLRGYMGS